MQKTDENADNKTLFERLRNIKHIDIIIAVVILLLVLVIYFIAFAKKKPEVTIDSDSNAEFSSEIEKVLSSIDGVGVTKVIINYDDNISVEIASREETVSKQDKDGSMVTVESKKEPIIVRGDKGDEPIILSRNNGNIKGVVVVAKGGDSPRVKLSIIDALTTLLDIDGTKIKVYGMR